jgi:hypothetical protein
VFAPGDADYRRAEGYRADVGRAPSPRLVALASALSRLLAASNGVTEALTHHDRHALEASNDLSDAIVVEIGELAGDLTDGDRAELATTSIPALREQLGIAARRNAVLIEQAWAVDAALMRLVLGAGKPAPDASGSGYGSAPGPAYVDRGA